MGVAPPLNFLVMARLDSYSTFPSGMEDYLSTYGWHFSKKMCEWAASKMYKIELGKKKFIEPYTKEKVDTLLKQYNVRLTKDSGYDSVYLANMCKADYLGKSVRSEADLVQFIYDSIEDPDGYEGKTFTRFYADCVGSGEPVIWEDML